MMWGQCWETVILLSKNKEAESHQGGGRGSVEGWTMDSAQPTLTLSLQLRKILALDHFLPVLFLRVGFKYVRLALNLM